ncbi:MAG: hypothetical protein IJB69_09585, partial [Clostridia bacterium]|nr:hypothetical protein [Clostridia bacterium]
TFPPAIFSFSPDAKHPAGGVPPPSPWVWRGRLQLAILQSSFANRFLRGGSAAANSQWNNRHL